MYPQEYYINISIQTPEGPKRLARFDLGSDRDAATHLFKRLKGSSTLNPKDLLFIEFMETINGLPMNVDMLTCDLQELGTNAMLITQDVFRLLNLKAN